MKKLNFAGVAVLSCVVLAGCGKECNESPDTSAKAPGGASPAFQRIADELDYGGDYYQVVNAETFRSDIVSAIDLVASCSEEVAVYAPTVVKAADRLGLLALRGRGESVKKLGPSVYEHRSFVRLDPAKTPLTDLTVAGEPTMPVTETYLPGTTVLGLSFSTDIRSVLPAAAECVDLFAPGEGTKALAMVKEVAPFIDGIGIGTALAVTLDEDRLWTVPELPTALSVPAPGVLIVQKLNDDMPWTALAAFLSAEGVSVAKHEKYAGVSVCTIPLPMPELKALRCEPVLAYDAEKKVLLAANMPDVLARALAAGRDGRGRLTDDAAFVQSIGRLEPHNALGYLSPKLVPAVAKAVREGMPPALMKDVPYALRKHLDNPPAFWCAWQAMRRPDGVAVRGRASFGACNTLRMLCDGGASAYATLLPILGGVAMPNFIKYQAESQEFACMSNMKQLTAAAECWRIEKAVPDVPALADLCGADKYIRTQPACPNGGTYELSLEGEEIVVRCSEHGSL